MKFLGILSIIILLLGGVIRAFSDSPNDWDHVLSRQKVEIVYRNALAQTMTAQLIDKTTVEIEQILYQHPFMSKTDRQWISDKLKELKQEKKKLLATKITNHGKSAETY